MTERTLRCTQPWAVSDDEADFGEERTYQCVSEDALNFYAHGVDSEPYPGISSNFRTLPKHSWANAA